MCSSFSQSFASIDLVDLSEYVPMAVRVCARNGVPYVCAPTTPWGQVRAMAAQTSRLGDGGWAVGDLTLFLTRCPRIILSINFSTGLFEWVAFDDAVSAAMQAAVVATQQPWPADVEPANLFIDACIIAGTPLSNAINPKQFEYREFDSCFVQVRLLSV